MSKSYIFRHIRKGEHHRIVITSKVLDLHCGIGRAHWKSLYHFHESRSLQSHSTTEFHHFCETDHTICDKRIIHELHRLSSAYTSHILEIRPHHRENRFCLFECLLLSSDKYCEISCDCLRGTSRHWRIEKADMPLREFVPDFFCPLDSYRRHIDNYRSWLESYYSTIRTE